MIARLSSVTLSSAVVIAGAVLLSSGVQARELANAGADSAAERTVNNERSVDCRAQALSLQASARRLMEDA